MSTLAKTGARWDDTKNSIIHETLLYVAPAVAHDAGSSLYVSRMTFHGTVSYHLTHIRHDFGPAERYHPRAVFAARSIAGLEDATEDFPELTQYLRPLIIAEARAKIQAGRTAAAAARKAQP